MQWVIGLCLVVLLGRVQAQETSDPTQELEKAYTESAYEQVIVRFNTDIKDFPSWQAFKTEVLSRVLAGTLGRCYERTTSPMQPVQITRCSAKCGGWGMGGDLWYTGAAEFKANKTFIEYRFNVKAGVLLRVEGVKTWFLPRKPRRCVNFLCDLKETPHYDPRSRGECGFFRWCTIRHAVWHPSG